MLIFNYEIGVELKLMLFGQFPFLNAQVNLFHLLCFTCEGYAIFPQIKIYN